MTHIDIRIDGLSDKDAAGMLANAYALLVRNGPSNTQWLSEDRVWMESQPEGNNAYVQIERTT